MDLPLNETEPLIMHIDLNSCYAIIEQQANRLIRYKPVGVAAYDSPGGFIIASSYEAKRLGIKLMRVYEARDINRDTVILTPDPEKYFDAHRRFKEVLERYTDEVTPKSIDEFVVDFRGSQAIQHGHSLVNVGNQIKLDIKKSLGEYVTVNIGIAPNRFLAKIAAGLNKPDGLDVIHTKDILSIYEKLDLMDLPGINYRFKARLNFAEIYTPLEFVNAPMHKLKHEVFQSVLGYYWYLRLRGYEVDAERFATRSFGNEYAIGKKTSNPDDISRLLMKLSEKTGRRLRKHDYQANGVYLGLGFENRQWWGKSRRTKASLFSTQEIFINAMRLMRGLRFPARAAHLNIAVYDVEPASPIQIGLFDGTRLDSRSLALAVDKMNDRYGEFTVIPALMANMDDIVIKRVPFGSVRDL